MQEDPISKSTSPPEEPVPEKKGREVLMHQGEAKKTQL